jgi:hypothetical protein
MVFLLKEADTNRRKLRRLVVFLEISSMQPVEIYGIWCNKKIVFNYHNPNP